MHSNKGIRWPNVAHAGIVLTVACAMLLGGCHGDNGAGTQTDSQASTDPAEANTPEGVFLRAREAAAKHDWKTFCECLTPNAQDTLAASLAVAGNMLRNMAAVAERAQNDEVAQRIQAQATPVIEILEKYKIRENLIAGVDPQLLQQDEPPRELVDQIVEGIENRNGFVAEMLGAMVSAQGGRPAVALGGELEDVKVEGDHAQGFLVTTKDGESSRDPIPFRRIDGQWRLEFTLQ